jgi:S-formylglutathione hydrolase
MKNCPRPARRLAYFAAALGGVLSVAGAPGALPLSAQTGTVERIKLHSPSLQGNLAGDPAERDVSVYLPPSYHAQPERRYPVVYMLHGFTDSDDKWFGLTQHWMSLPEVIDRSLGRGAREMIVVTPNAYNRFAGSMYSSSVTVGDWETFIARELVAHVDGRYRTLARRESRGLAGHSMGGYGTLRIAMKNPDVFSSIYALNPCCLAANVAPPTTQAGATPGPSAAERIRTDEEFESAGFGVKAALASAAAWSPNPENPPFYVDLPTREGQWRPEVAARWAANAPLAMIDQYVFSLRRLRAIGLDAGTREASIAPTTRALHEALNRYGIENLFEIYEGDHVNRVAERIETVVLPFFSQHLEFAPGTQ